MPRISAIIPCYNGAHFLPDALESALAQTYSDCELIVVDDGSTDATGEVAARYCERYPGRVRYIRQENQGLAAARNAAIEQSGGELLALLDCDDLWLPERLAEGVRIMDADPKAGLVHANILRVDGDLKPIGVPDRSGEKLAGRIWREIYVRRAHISCPTALFRRSCLEETGLFDTALSRLGCEDRDLWFRIARGFEVAYIPRVLAHYRVTAASMSRNPEKMLRARMHVLDKYDDGTAAFRAMRREGFAAVCEEMAAQCRAAGNRAEARSWTWKGFRSCPLQKRFAVPALKSLAGMD